MALKYRKKAVLTDGHRLGITAVSFSPLGTNLATADVEGKVCIWNAEQVWLPTGEDVVIFGTENGNISLLTIDDAMREFAMNGFWAHRLPVEALAVTGDHIASGGQGELKIWRWSSLEHRYKLLRELPHPTKTSQNKHKKVAVTSLHWTGTEASPRLMVTYLHHGVQMFDALSWQCVQTMSLQGKIGSASLSSDGSLLAVFNLVNGFDVYRTDTAEPVISFETTVNEPLIMPVLFIHGGNAIVGGSADGKVDIWDIYMGKMHSLSIPNNAPVRALSAHCQPTLDSSPYEFSIATGIYNEKGESACIIWQAMERETSQAITEPALAQDNTSFLSKYRVRKSTLVWTGLAIVILVCALFVSEIDEA